MNVLIGFAIAAIIVLWLNMEDEKPEKDYFTNEFCDNCGCITPHQHHSSKNGRGWIECKRCRTRW